MRNARPLKCSQLSLSISYAFEFIWNKQRRKSEVYKVMKLQTMHLCYPFEVLEFGDKQASKRTTYMGRFLFAIRCMQKSLHINYFLAGCKQSSPHSIHPPKKKPLLLLLSADTTIGLATGRYIKDHEASELTRCLSHRWDGYEFFCFHIHKESVEFF